MTSAPVPCSIVRRDRENSVFAFIGFLLTPSSWRRDLTARMIAVCVPHRHLSPASASLISASVGFFFVSRNAAAVMTQPLMQ